MTRGCVAHKGYVPWLKFKAIVGSEVKLCLEPCLSSNLQTTEVNLKRIKAQQEVVKHTRVRFKVKATFRDKRSSFLFTIIKKNF